jgi:hypothetical protein
MVPNARQPVDTAALVAAFPRLSSLGVQHLGLAADISACTALHICDPSGLLQALAVSQ